MKQIHETRRYQKDAGRCMKRGLDMRKLLVVIRLLAENQPLPIKCRPHKLVGNYEGFWECHIAPDWLLIYEYDDDNLYLSRTGTHADLFK